MSVADAGPPDSMRKSQFAIVPMWAHRKIVATRTRTMALAVYVELVGQYAGSTRDAEGLRVWPEIQQIADSMGVPKRNIERALAVLVDCGVVLKKRTVRRNQYWLPQEDPGAFVETLANFQSATSGGLDSVQNATSGGPGTATSGAPQSATSGGLYNPDPSIQTQGTHLSSPPVPTQRPAEPTATEKRETGAPPNNLTTAQRIVRAAAIVTPDEEQQFIAWVTATHQPRGGAWWRTVDANGDLPDLATTWRAEQTPQAPTATSNALPPWCGHCDGEPLAMRWTEDTDGRTRRCTRCHPDATPTPTRRGWQPYRDPIDHSVYDLGFDGRPLPGTDTKVAGWLALANTLDTTEG